MEYCKRCLYPANAKPTIILDDEGVCSGCRYHESRQRIDWSEREKLLGEMLSMYKAKARESGSIYDCIIPISGGKDSHYQVHLIKNVYGMNPLLVTFNHAYNTRLGVRNLRNLIKQFDCDLIRFTVNPGSARKLSRYMVKTVGDITWHYHAGIRTFPFQVAVNYKIPLIIWGEHGFAELTGVVTLEDMVEFTKWTRREHDMRGFEPDDLINEQSGITWQDLTPYIYPEDEAIEALDLRGIYLSNFVRWDAKQQAELVIEKYDFNIYKGKKDRTFNLYGKTDDHANDVHDYMKYLKFGYGRATDDASMEIRHGRMTREEGAEMVRQYDHVRPRTLDLYLRFLDMTEEEFVGSLDGMRDTDIWERGSDGKWRVNDSVVNHVHDPGVEEARVPQIGDRTLGKANAHLFFNEWSSTGESQPERSVDDSFIVL
jgi:N-acetyl sugar amidotransferase